MKQHFKFLLLIPALLIFGSTWAQQGEDMVRLRDGSVYRGTIMEQVKEQHVKLKTLDGETKTFPIEEVKQTSLGKLKSLRKSGSIQIGNGYYNHTDLGLMFGLNSNQTLHVGPSIRMVNGYQLGRYNFGLGVGFDSFQQGFFVPLYAEGRYNFLKGSTSPFVALQAGYSLGINKQPVYYDYWFGAPVGREVGGGFIGALQFGVRKYTSDNFGFSLSIGQRFQHSKSSYQEYFWNGSEESIIQVEEILRLFRTEFRIGIFFN